MNNQSVITKKLVCSLLPPRKKNAHKGEYGHVLIIAGSRGMAGAAALCAHGALRSGAGLVSVAVPETIEKIVSCHIRPEAMVIGCPVAPSGTFASCAAQKLLKVMRDKRISAVVIGPGMGVNAETKKLVLTLLRSCPVPMVLDADALNLVGGTKKSGMGYASLKSTKAPVIVTPHPGEFARLTGKTTAAVQKNRSGAAREFAHQNNVVCVLKGHQTVVTDGTSTYINTTGNPGMATGGSGDVLAGMIGALLEQVKSKSALNAAAAGVYLHGCAGDRAALKKTQAGLLADDIAEQIPSSFRALANK